MIALGPTWVTATGWDTVEDWVEGRLSSRWGAAEGADFDQEGLCAEVREVINDNLPAGWTLVENQFVGPTPIPEDALNIVRNTIDEIDFWEMAQILRQRRLRGDTSGCVVPGGDRPGAGRGNSRAIGRGA